MKLRPCDFVALECMSLRWFGDSFQLWGVPSPSYYASRVVGTFSADEVGFVLDVHCEGQSEEEFALILTPTGVGWLNVDYLERIE